jgi:hypothetical protein
MFIDSESPYNSIRGKQVQNDHVERGKPLRTWQAATNMARNSGYKDSLCKLTDRDRPCQQNI